MTKTALRLYNALTRRMRERFCRPTNEVHSAIGILFYLDFEYSIDKAKATIHIGEEDVPVDVRSGRTAHRGRR